MLKQWLINIGTWTACIYLYANLRKQKPHTLRARVRLRERERDRDRDRESERMEGKGKEGDIPVTVDQPQSPIPTQSSTGSLTKWLNYLKYKGDWLEETRGSLMVVATVITTITYQPAFSPPGGVWSQNMRNAAEGIGCNEKNVCTAGTLLLAYNFQATYLAFIVCNTIAFTSSLSVTFLLISGFPFKNDVFMALLAFCMCTTLTFLGVTYVLAFAMLIPGTLYFKLLWTVIFIPIGVLLFLIVVVVLTHTVRFLYWLAKKIASDMSST